MAGVYKSSANTTAVTFNETQHTVAEIREDELRRVEGRTGIGGNTEKMI
jgi:hypothetical protein